MSNKISNRESISSEDRVFVWFNPDENCIEIQHGNKGTCIAFEEDVDVFIIPLTTTQYAFPKEEYIYDINGRIVASLVENIENTRLDIFIVRYRRQNIYFEVPHGTPFHIVHEWF